ncbi:hypothetical protein BDW02DRAFT_246390, partial [Decorospora gaudefroyi]
VVCFYFVFILFFFCCVRIHTPSHEALHTWIPATCFWHTHLSGITSFLGVRTQEFSSWSVRFKQWVEIGCCGRFIQRTWIVFSHTTIGR